MALFKILKGSSSDLSSQAIREGYCYVTTDEGKMYIDISSNKRICLNSGDATRAETADKADKLTNSYLINGVPFNGTSDVYYYGVCSTEKATAAKVVTLNNDTPFTLKAGVTLAIKFTNANSASSPTLNVNSTGAKPIYQYGTTKASTSTATSWAAGAVVLLTYDGTGWIRHYFTDSNTIPSAYCSTAANTAAKTASCSNYAATPNSYLHLLVVYENTSAGAITLNVNSKGAKPIYINGTASSSSNYLLKAGSYLTFYDGTNYYVRTDGKLPGTIEKADAFTSAKIITLTGDVTGAGSSTGANGGWEIETTIKDDSHNHTNYVQKTGDTMTGDLVINGANGTKGWVVRRNGGDSESVKLTVDDSNATFTYTNDERSNNFKFVLNNTDTEAPADPAAPATSVSQVLFSGANNKSTVTADYFTGNGANLTNLNASKITSGILGTANGGTGKGTWTPYGIVYASDKSTLAQLGIGSANQVLASQGSGKAPVWKTLSDIVDATYVNVTGDTMTGDLTAPNFIGHLTGNADTATHADEADTATNALTAGNLGEIDAGNSSRPVYFQDGLPKATTYRMAGTNATATTALSVSSDLPTGIWYVNGTNSGDHKVSNFNQSDGVVIANQYSDKWITEIYQDYRTGQLAVRGKNNGTWQAWRKVLDDTNYTSYTVKKNGTGATGTWGINISGNAATATSAISAGTADSATKDSAGNTISSTYVKKSGDTMTGLLTLNEGLTSAKVITLSGTTAANAQIHFNRTNNPSYFTTGTGGSFAFIPNGQSTGTAVADLIIRDSEVTPGTTNVTTLGTSSLKWKNVYATTFTGALDGNAKTATSAGTATAADSATSAEYLKTSIAFTPAETAITPDEVYALIGQYGRIKRGTWHYAGNGYIAKGDNTTTQCPFGGIDLAGTTVIQAANNSTQYTQLFITPPKSSSTPDAITGEMIYYINNGETYSPTWYRVLTDKNFNKYAPKLDGSGATGKWSIDISGTADTAKEAVTAGSAGSATKATYLIMSKASDDANRHVFFANNGDSGSNEKRAVYDDDFQYNPSTNTLTVGSITGNAATATKATYIATEKGTSDADRHVFFAYANDAVGNQRVVVSDNIKYNPSKNILTVGTVKGNLDGNAKTATTATSAGTATSAEKDGSGNVIASTYVKKAGDTMSGDLLFSGSNKDQYIKFLHSNDDGASDWRLGHLGTGSGNTNYFVIESGQDGVWKRAVQIGMTDLNVTFGGNLVPAAATNTQTIGTSSLKWKNIYATTFTGNLVGNADTATSATSAGTAVSADTATVANKLGTTTVGGTSTPIYLNSGVATACDKPASGSWFKGIPSVGSDGVQEIGRYIDFHYTSASTNDYDVRIDSAGTNKNTIYLPGVSGQVVVHTNDTAIGNITKPVYIAASGLATECSNYAGGTAVTLNGTSKGATTASFYAPTASGTAGQLLVSKGSSTAPSWSNLYYTTRNSTGQATPGTITELNIYGSAYGEAANTITDGKLSNGDPGPQIRFGTAKDSGQSASLIFSHYDRVSAGCGASLHLVSSESNVAFIAPTIKALTKFIGNLDGNAKTATEAGTAATATKATQDASGNVITSTYLNKTKDDTTAGNITFSGEKATIFKIARKKTDGGGWAYAPIRLIGNDNAVFANIGVYGTGNNLGYIYIGASSTYNAATNMQISPAGTVTAPKFKGELDGNAKTATSAVSAGSAESATKDGSGNVITSTYLNKTKDDTMKGELTLEKNLTFSGSNKDQYIKFLHSNDDGASDWRLGHLGTGSGNTNYFVIESGQDGVWKRAVQIGMTDLNVTLLGNLLPTTTNTQTIGTSSLKWKNIYATTFTGNLDGNAKTATTATSAGTATKADSATKATQDGAGNVITSTYVKKAGDTMTGPLNVTYNSSTWLNSANGKSAINVTGSSYVGWIAGNSKNGKLVISSYPGNDDVLYFNYMSNDTISAGTNSMTKQMKWDGATNTLTATKFVGELDGNAKTATSAGTATSADKATKLATARTLKIGESGKIFNGTANVTWTDNEIGYYNLIARGTEFADAQDLNSVGYGNYFANNSTKSATLVNGPLTTAGFRLIHQRGYNSTANTYDWQFAYSSSRTIYQRYRNSSKEWSGWGVQVLKHSLDALGNATTPVYVKASGEVAKCSAYAGGTAVTLNGTSKGATTASFYAPTSAGTKGNLLVSNGSGAPTWTNIANVTSTNASGRTNAGKLSTLFIYGNTYGNDATYLSKAGQLSYGDPGPQITFNTGSPSSPGSQAASLIFTDHDTIASGCSLSLVSNQTNVSFIAPTIKALTKFIGTLDGNATSATTASRISLGGVADSTKYGDYGGIIQDSTTGPESGSWHNSIKILHNNANNGWYTQLAQNFTGTEGMWHRSCRNGTVGSWYRILDSNCYTNYVYSKSTSDDRYVYLSGDTMTGKLRLGKSAQSGMTNATGIHVHDLRSATITADTFGDQAVNFIFDNRLGTSDWRSAIQVKGWNGSYAAWQLSGGAGTAASNKLYYREGVGSTWGTWYSIPFENRANTFTSLNKFTGNVEISNLLTVATGNSHYGIKLGSTYLNAINEQVIFQNNGAIRFGTDNWDWNCWAGLKYVHGSNNKNGVVYLGVADGTVFNANAPQSEGTLALPGIRYLSINGKTAIDAHDSWLRINEGKAFSSGIYMGTNVVRTDGQFQIGSNGGTFYAKSDGTGYFDNDVKVKGHVFAYNYGRDGNNAPALIFDKPSSNYTGIGSNGVSDTIYFGAVTTDTFAWKTDYQQKWRFNGEVQALGANAFRMAYGNYGVFLRNDGSDTYFLVTASGDQYGSWNNLRPFYFNNATGNVTMGHNAYAGGALGSGTRIYCGYDSGVTGSISCSNWFRTNGVTGLYNGDYGTHLMPNAVSSYAGWRVSGKRGDYHGILIGDATTSMAIMSIDNSHQGLYTQSGTGWIIYNNNANGCIGIGTSGLASGYKVTIGGSTYTDGTMVANGQLRNAAYKGGKWISGRDNALVRTLYSTSGSSFAPIVSAKTQLGSWDLGPCNPNENFYFSYATDANYNAGTNNTNTTVYITNAGKIYGAVWNDYAEYRNCITTFEAGQVVCENGDDTLSLATERLQPGACIVSDTFGFAIGQTDIADCPIAVSGRVLAYPYEPRESYKAGDPVCAGPNGTVSKMTREEVREYPDRMIGTVSAIPKYETWGQENVPVNGRIWIKVV